MVTALDFILDFIRIDLIVGFGWYSILFFVLRLFKPIKETLSEFDRFACKTVVFLGMLFMAVWLVLVTFNYFALMQSQEKTEFIQRITGPYGFGYFLQPLFWLILTQLLRIRLVRKFLIFRLMVAIPFVLTFERFVIIYSSFQNDYLPSSWSIGNTFLGITWWQLLLSILVKAIEFVLIALAYKYAQQQVMPKFKTAIS